MEDCEQKVLDYITDLDVSLEDKVSVTAQLLWQNCEARAEQLPPGEKHDVWYLLGGRGSGKTRASNEELSRCAQNYDETRWAVVAPTFGDCRLICFEGESGLLNVIPKSVMYGGTIDSAYNRSNISLKLRNDTILQGFSSEKPDRLRGPQFHGWLVEEPGSWKDSNKLPTEKNSTFSNLLFASRLKHSGLDGVKGIIAGTPRRCKLLTGDTEHPGLLNGWDVLKIAFTKMRSKDNLDNLAKVYQDLILNLEGTRIGRQELDAEILLDVEGALVRQDWIVIDQDAPTRFQYVVVGLDPAGSVSSSSDETGIVVVGLDLHGVYWVLEDLSGKFSPSEWASVAWSAFERWEADKIVVERNFGGDMVAATLRAHADADPRTVAEVSASRGKMQRFEPVSLLYEPSSASSAGDRIRHADKFYELEDQMTSFTQGSGFSPDRFDACAWGLIWLSKNEAPPASDFVSIFGTSAKW